jgi:Lhr-like helicase
MIEISETAAHKIRTLIVDEIHAVVGNRRGSHLALSVERLGGRPFIGGAFGEMPT